MCDDSAHSVKLLLNSTVNAVCFGEREHICVAVIPLVLSSLMRQRKWCGVLEKLVYFLTKSSQRMSLMPENRQLALSVNKVADVKPIAI